MDKVKQITTFYYDENDSLILKRINHLKKYNRFNNNIVNIYNYKMSGEFERQYTLNQFDKNNNLKYKIIFKVRSNTELYGGSQVNLMFNKTYYNNKRGNLMAELYGNCGVDLISNKTYYNKYNKRGLLIEVEGHDDNEIMYFRDTKNRSILFRKKYYYDTNLYKISTDGFDYQNEKVYSGVEKFTYDNEGNIIERHIINENYNYMTDEPHTLDLIIKTSIYYDDDNNEVKEEIVYRNGKFQSKEIKTKNNKTIFESLNGPPFKTVDYEYENGVKKFEITKGGGTLRFSEFLDKNYYLEKIEYLYNEPQYFYDPDVIAYLEDVTEVVNPAWEFKRWYTE